LTNLRSLYLGNSYFSKNKNQIEELPDTIGNLTSLQSLDLIGNQLSSLPEVIGNLTSLQSLDLSSNQLSSLPEAVGNLTSLQSLDLSSNQLSSLPKWIQSLNQIETLDLRGNPLPIPPEVLGPKEPYYNPNPANETLGFYLALQAEIGSVPLYEAKLILVGEGGAGKTSLAKKIDNEEYSLSKEEEPTEGIDVIRWNFDLPDGNTFRVNIWDFGGQEIYHATHQFFLTKRSLYLLVADTRKENTDFYYWLKIVELLSDSSPVLVIKNEKYNRQCEIDEGLFKGQFNNLKDYLPTNLENNRGLPEIKEAIQYRIKNLSHIGNPLPKIWVRVRSALENYAQNCNTITLETYFDICKQNGFTDKHKMLSLSSYLHDLGVCLHFQEDKLLKRTVILKPEWATTAVYKVADSSIVKENKGRFTEAEAAAIWSDSEYAELKDELLQLMIRFKLAYELPNRPGCYIDPQILPISQPFYPWDATNNLVLRYTYDFMPKGILTRFVVETHTRIENQNHVWKNGVVLKDNWARAEVIETYHKKEIKVRVSGSNKKPLLEVIRGELWKIHESYERLQYKELIPCNCKKCANSADPEFYSHELLMQYLNDHRYKIECRRSYQPVDVRRLISDITDSSAQIHIEEDREIARAEAYRSRTENPKGFAARDISNSIVILGNDNTANLEFAQSAQDIKTLLDEFSEEYNANSLKGQNKIKEDAIEKVQQNPDIKTRFLKALKASGEQALIEAVNHPAARVTIKGLKAFYES
ncbi:MAG: COR domain-containing protein, partial [Cyanobacteria bacterium J06650_10]